jgi:hypothetical protein
MQPHEQTELRQSSVFDDFSVICANPWRNALIKCMPSSLSAFPLSHQQLGLSERI